MTISDIMKELDFTILDICDDYLKEIISMVFGSINSYHPEDDNWMDPQEKIEELVYDCLTEVFITTSKTISESYKDAKQFKIKDVFKLCYSVDGKSITDRIKGYLDEAHKLLQQSYPIMEVKSRIISRFDTLLTTESSNVKTAIKENRRPDSADILVIEGGCGCGHRCDQYIGIYAADENVEKPPYHPNCICLWYYDITDNPDEIDDIELDN